MKARRGVAWAILALIIPCVYATPLDDIKAASGLRSIDIAQLQRGEITTNRGALGGNPRGVYAESCYIIHAPPARVVETLSKWDPTKHPELEVRTSRDFSWPAEADAFATLQLRADDQWLIDRTATGHDGDLNLPASARAKLPRTAAADSASAFWRELLLAINGEISAGGLDRVAPIRASRGEISAFSEFDALLKMAPEIAKHFQPLVERRPFRDGRAQADMIAPWWEVAKTHGHPSVHSGFVAAVRQSENSWQAADCTFYASDSFFFSVSLYQISPTADGTLVWQVDFVSAPFPTFAGSVARYFAQGEMLKDTAQTVRAFRSDVERSR